MGKINYGRVILGGLLAGAVITIGELILNGLFVGDQWRAFLEEHNASADSPGAMAMYVVMNFIVGLAIVWLYAAVRPRFGEGPKTAIIAGVFVWLVLWVLGIAGMGVSFEIPAGLVAISLTWGLVEIVLAALTGGWVYNEEG